jgi:hypothetical protein
MAAGNLAVGNSGHEPLDQQNPYSYYYCKTSKEFEK